jgi:hypothetical protein
VIVRVRPQLLLLSTNDLVTVGVPQSSVAVTALISPVGMVEGLQPRFWSAAHCVKLGAVLSAVQVIVWTQVALLPQASVATYVIVRVWLQPLLLSTDELEIVGVPQLSVAVTRLLSPVGMLLGLQPRSRPEAHFVNEGAVVSAFQVICWTQVAVLPQESVAT